VLTVALAFLYYMALISFISLARQGTRSELAAWLPDASVCVFGIVMLVRLEAPGDRDLIGALTARLQWLLRPVAAPAGAWSARARPPGAQGLAGDSGSCPR
jgi:hypothetical protein